MFSTGALPMATQYYFDKVHQDGKGGAGAVTQMIVKGVAGRESTRNQIYQASELSLRITGDKEENPSGSGPSDDCGHYPARINAGS